MKTPTPPEIADSPELASLAIVHAAIHLMDRALLAAHPELVGRGEQLENYSSPLLDIAWELCVVQTAMQRMIENYAARLEQLAAEQDARFNDVEF